FEWKTFRQLDHRVLPAIGDWGKSDSRRKARHNNDNHMTLELPRKRDHTISITSTCSERQIIAVPEKIDMFASEPQRALNKKHFDSSVRPVLQKIFDCPGR